MAGYRIADICFSTPQVAAQYLTDVNYDSMLYSTNYRVMYTWTSNNKFTLLAYSDYDSFEIGLIPIGSLNGCTMQTTEIMESIINRPNFNFSQVSLADAGQYFSSGFLLVGSLLIATIGIKQILRVILG